MAFIFFESNHYGARTDASHDNALHLYKKQTMEKSKIIGLAGIAALFLATGAAHAVEWQCGPHYVSTIVLHGENWDRIRGCKYPIIAYPSYNQTREEAFKNNPSGGGDDEIGLPSHGFRWSHARRGGCVLTYRGKPCFQYPIEAQGVTYDKFMSDLTDEIRRRYPSMTEKEINEIGFHADFHIGSYHMVCPMKLKPATLDKCGVVLDGSEANK